RTAMPPTSGGGDGDGPRSRETSITQPYPTIKQLGPYTYSTQQVTDGKTAHWRVWNWARVGGPSKVIDRGPQQFLEQLVAQARGAGHDMLVLTIENIEAESVQRFTKPGSPMVKHLGATAVERIDDRTIRLVIPLGGKPAGGGAGSGSGGGAASRPLMVVHDDPRAGGPARTVDTSIRGVGREGPSAIRTSGAGPDDVTPRHPTAVPKASPTETTHSAPLDSAETEAVVGGIGREPSRRPVQPKDPVVVGGPGREPGRTSDAPKDRVVVGGPGRQPGRTSDDAKDPVS